eukprot:SAG11_NODE_34594_length_271_cov_0.598837_1_plen_75_part_01
MAAPRVVHCRVSIVRFGADKAIGYLCTQASSRGVIGRVLTVTSTMCGAILGPQTAAGVNCTRLNLFGSGLTFNVP